MPSCSYSQPSSSSVQSSPKPCTPTPPPVPESPQMSPIVPSSAEATPVRVTTNKGKGKKRTADEAETEDIDNQLATINNHISNMTSDEAALFGHSIAAKMRKYSSFKFALARRQIEKLLFDLEYGSQHTQLQPTVSNTAPAWDPTWTTLQ